MYIEGNGLNISHYSICFPILFRADGSTIIDTYFTNVKVDKDYIRWRDWFAIELNSAIVKHKRHNDLLVVQYVDDCKYEAKECQNYACRCLRLANKFHDDYLVDNKVLQVSLGCAYVEYRYTEEENTKYVKSKINLILHITNEDPYPKSDDRTNETNYNTQLIFEVHDNGINTQSLIFLKHLFYKRSLKCTISYGDTESELTSITDWANSIIYDLIDSFADIRTKENNLDPHFCFDSSFAEINFDTNEKVSDIYKNHSNEFCGMLTANEEYKFLSDEYVNNSLEARWGCYDSSLYYFLNGSVLNVRTKHKELDYTRSLTEYFTKYKRQRDGINKYIDRTEAKNCIAGLKDVVLYLYLDCNKKRFVLQEAIDESKKLLENPQKRDQKSIQERQNKINSIISTYPHGAIGRYLLDQRMVSMFYIESLSESLRDCNSRMSALVESLHNDELTQKVLKLTYITVVIPIVIFLIELLLSADGKFTKLCASVILVIVIIFVAYSNRKGIKYFKEIVVLSITTIIVTIFCLYLLLCVLQQQPIMNIIHVIC